jgi:hypothetical protein
VDAKLQCDSFNAESVYHVMEVAPVASGHVIMSDGSGHALSLSSELLLTALT